MEAFASEDRRLRALAAKQLALNVAENSRFLKLLLLVEATLDGTFDHFLSACRFCWEEHFVSVGLHLAWRCISEKANDDSHLYRGLLRGKADLRSLAFADYRAAAQHGASVAKSNMASLLSDGPVAEAGLEILREHIGNYNAAEPGYPYQTRAALERSVSQEVTTELELRSYGARVATAVHRLLESWRRRGDCKRSDGNWQATTGRREWALRVSDGHVSATVDSKPLAVQELSPLAGFYVALEANELRLLFLFSEDLEAVALNGLAEKGVVEWLDLQAVVSDSNPSPALLGDASMTPMLPAPEGFHE